MAHEEFVKPVIKRRKKDTTAFIARLGFRLEFEADPTKVEGLVTMVNEKDQCYISDK